ncbi:NHLP bacteriocin export ABC transporter permease/ATPase subunit [Anoxynatronum buryatiense]|uniref:ATP-binding cassette, subfamily C n=1 Tax=Anoxynatronum buryatiense TaxID=489973 RepID=A0AA45WWI3_9CLOT|nr:NHLP bacteriocin export ABC transporter permease/ATPase subunit [Anoxynatronum buryatiense]SMP58040.1 ATP-binding cassette, subfamily C [Anoxynatronum buryatiense]
MDLNTEKMYERIKSLGTPLELVGNKPLLFQERDKVYLVISGKVDLFSVKIEGFRPAGRRQFLLEITEGELLFPLLPYQENQRGILMNGRHGTSVLVMERSRFVEALKNQGQLGKELEKLLVKWLERLQRHMLPETVHSQFHLVSLDNSPVTVQQQERIRTPNRFLWVRVDTGRLSLYDWEEGVILTQGQWAPLSPMGWLTATENTSITLAVTPAMVEEGWLDEALSWMHLAFKAYLGYQEKKSVVNQHRQQAEKQKFNRWFVKNSLLQLVQVTEKVDDILIEEAVIDPFLAACQMVGKKQHIPIPASIDKLLTPDSKDPLGEIAKAARFNVRQVILREGWHREDHGPLLAYWGKDKKPVALIPENPSRYWMYDPATQESSVVSSGLAEELEGFAHYFYRPFPNKALKAKDLIQFGLTSSWRRDLVLVLLMGIAGGILGMLTPVATGVVFDSVIPEGERTQLLQIGFLLGAVALANTLFELTRSFAMTRLEGKMDGSIQAAVWDRLLALPVPFFKEYTSGELAMRAMGITQIRKIVSGAAVNTILTSLFSIFTFGLLFYYNKRLALFATIPVVISILVTLALGWFQVRYEKKLIDFSKEIQGLVLQLFNGVAKFRVAGAENRAFHQWAKAFSQQRKVALKNETVANVMKTFNAIFPVMISMFIFYLVIKSTKSYLDPGKFIAFNSALGSLIGYMTRMSETFITINAIIPMYKMTTPILEAMPEYDEAKGDVGMLTGEIEVSRVSFRYKEGAPLVLKDISFKIQEGEYVALVGSSGSGKSTLFRVLLGFEKPETGQIYYNGKDLTKVDIRSVRRQLGVVLQNGQLMSGDIFSNIVGSKANLTMEDAWDAARRAGMEEDIKAMPMGMHTVISEGSSTLSGGQRQRLLIARAIVSRPRIIYFDEATSALDNRTQKIVSESLDQLSATRVVIAHRLSTIINCQRIIVMDQGEIAEQGTYEELMNMNGIFAQLAKRQLA